MAVQDARRLVRLAHNAALNAALQLSLALEDEELIEAGAMNATGELLKAVEQLCRARSQMSGTDLWAAKERSKKEKAG